MQGSLTEGRVHNEVNELTSQTIGQDPGAIEAVHLLMAQGARPEARTLMAATENGQDEAGMELLHGNSALGAQLTPEALRTAAARGPAGIVGLMLDQGAGTQEEGHT